MPATKDSMHRLIRTASGEAERQAEARSSALMLEFHAHKDEFEAIHPEHASEDRMIFEAWAIQKIAGLQLSVEHLAELLNRHLSGKTGN